MNLKNLFRGEINHTTILCLSDCMDVLKKCHENGGHGFIDLIYIDPPFNSKRNYNILFDSEMSEEAFKDTRMIFLMENQKD